MFSNSRPGHFNPVGGAIFTHWTRGWVGLGVGLDVSEKRNISCPCRDPRTAWSSSVKNMWNPTFRKQQIT